jgi:hypothetical protein
MAQCPPGPIPALRFPAKHLCFEVYLLQIDGILSITEVVVTLVFKVC